MYFTKYLDTLLLTRIGYLALANALKLVQRLRIYISGAIFVREQLEHDLSVSCKLTFGFTQLNVNYMNYIEGTA